MMKVMARTARKGRRARYAPIIEGVGRVDSPVSRSK
jgi:hypothetical protein